MKYLKWGIVLILAIVAFHYGSLAGDWLLGLTGENKRLHQELIGQKEKYEQLSTRAAKLENQYVDQQTLRAELERQFRSEKDALTGRIKVLSNATFLIREKARKSSKSDLVYQGKRIKYVLNEIRYNDGPPVGYILIFDDGRVVSKLYNHQLEVKTAVSRDESSGKYSVVNRAEYILKSPSLNLNGEQVWTNKPYDLPITGGKAFIDPTEPRVLKKRFHLWAPRLNAEFGFDGSEIRPGLGVSLAGYGYTQRDLDFKFLQLGAQYSDTKTLLPTLTPVLWRPLPRVFSNTYLGAGSTFHNPGFGFFFSLQVGL